MLLGMLLWWFVTVDRERLPTLDPGMTLPYISDIGAVELKPLFIAGSVVTTITFDLSFATERWLRHKGRLVPNTSIGEKILMGLTIVFAIVGTVGLICLSIFDTWRHAQLHDIFLILFIGGYMISAVFICWEYQRLGISMSPPHAPNMPPKKILTNMSEHREHRVLRISFWMKLTFILVELALAVAFGVTTFTDHKSVAAYLEWIIAFIFTFYILSYIVDLWPARVTRRHSMRFSKPVSPREIEGSEGSLPMRSTGGHF